MSSVVQSWTSDTRQRVGRVGAAVAAAVIGAWCAMLVFLLSAPAELLSLPLILAGLLVMTHLYTGLFITAHDAMHGSVYPANRRINDALGRLAVALYAAFPYKVLLREHRRHHKAPASDNDPDFHDGEHPSPIRWYLRFVGQYVRWQQIVILAVAFNVASHLIGIDEWRLFAFWVLPSLLSTFQLFYFGTYLPHREHETGYADAHRSRTQDLPGWLSFLTCYHFGYHWEHHAWPHVPWWQLPAARRHRLHEPTSPASTL